MLWSATEKHICGYARQQDSRHDNVDMIDTCCGSWRDCLLQHKKCELHNVLLLGTEHHTSTCCDGDIYHVDLAALPLEKQVFLVYCKLL